MDNVAEIKSRLNIVEFIGTYVQLKRTGKNYKGLCPFHSEKSPSFIVSEDIQRYRCFGCGKSGDIFNFVEEYEGLEFQEALKLLADKAGVTLEFNESQQKEKGEAQKIIELNALATKVFHHLLTKHEYGKSALEYLKNRGISTEIIDEFKLGYAPKSWNALSTLIRNKNPNITEADLVKAGLARSRENGGIYDMFRDRLLFPFVDPLNRTLGFSARTLIKDELPKYVNTAETLVFHKERFLFGLNLSKQYVRKADEIIIVEGMMDMISLYQHGYKNVASTNGTALTNGQINLLKRYTENIVLIFDNDAAGQEAMIRGIKVIQNSGVNIKIGFLPNSAKDPDELMQSNPKSFEDVVKKAIPIWDFYFNYASHKYNFDDVYERKSALGFLLENIKQIDNDVIRSEYVKKIAELFDVSEESVVSQMAKVQVESTVSSTQIVSEQAIISTDIEIGAGYPPTEIYTLMLLTRLKTPDLRTYLDIIDSDYFSDPTLKSILDSLKNEVDTKKTLDIKAFYDKLQSSQTETVNLFEKIYLLGLDDSLDNSDIIFSELASAINRLKRSYYNKQLKNLAIAIKKAETVSDSELIEKLQKEAQEISVKLNELSI